MKKIGMQSRKNKKESLGLDRPVLAAILGKQSGSVRIAFVSFCFFLLSARVCMKKEK